MTEETKVTFNITELRNLKFNLEMPVSEFFDKFNEIQDTDITENFNRLSERVKITLGELALPSLDERTVIQDLSSRVTSLPMKYLTSNQQVDYIRQILLNPETLSEELLGVLEEASAKHIQLTTFLAERIPLEDIVEELASQYPTCDILTALAGAV